MFPWLQTIGIPTGIDPTPFRANLYLYNYKCKYSANLIRTNKLSGRQFHSTFGFIDDLCTNFLDLNISVNKGKLIYKMSDKRDTFNFQIHRTPSVTSNVPFISFYSSTMSEFVRSARSTLLLNQMINGGSEKRHAIEIQRVFRNIVLWLQILYVTLLQLK